MRFVKIKSWLAGLLVLALVGCGGGGGGSAGDPVLGGGSGGSSAADVQIKFSPQSVDNSGTENVTATITAINAAGQGVGGVPIALSVDSGATFNITSTNGNVTGSDGTVVAVVTIGNNYAVRTVTMTASAPSVSPKTATFDVTGSRQVASDLTLTVAPSASIRNTVTNTVTVTATAVDANRNALPNIPITLSVNNGATLVPSGTVSGADGSLTGTLKIGADQSNRDIKVTATSGTVVKTMTVQVTGATLSASGFTSTVGVGSANNKITYVLVDNTGVKMQRYPYTVSASGLPGASGITNDDGEFQYTYTAPTTAQTLTITAIAAGAPNVQTITVTGTAVIPPVLADSVKSASVSASPSVVAVNTVGTSTNKTEIRALFVGINNAPIKNVRVWFDLDADKQSIGGVLDSKAAGVLMYSDSNGVARTTYAPGSRFSPKDGVTVRACWAYVDFVPPADGLACPNAVTTTLTVVSDSLSVSIGTNGTLSIGASGLTYVKRFAVQVVDSSGQAKAGVQVSPSIDLLNYYKGFWSLAADPTKWTQGGFGNIYPSTYPEGGTVPLAARFSALDSLTPSWVPGNVTICGNEDLNRNGISENFLEFFQSLVIPEDQNGSGSLIPQRPQLDPRKADVTIAVEGSASTDGNGIVVLKIEYPQNIASWVSFNILVSASGVAGTEGRANYEGILPALATAITTVASDPPFKISPYGTQGSDTFLRKNAEGQSGWLCRNPL